jgi:hypothetical protein
LEELGSTGTVLIFEELGSHIGGVGFSYWRSWVLILEELGSTLTVLIFGGVGFYGYGSHSFTCG